VDGVDDECDPEKRAYSRYDHKEMLKNLRIPGSYAAEVVEQSRSAMSWHEISSLWPL
jgi:hypothetical protein